MMEPPGDAVEVILVALMWKMAGGGWASSRKRSSGRHLHGLCLFVQALIGTSSPRSLPLRASAHRDVISTVFASSRKRSSGRHLHGLCLFAQTLIGASSPRSLPLRASAHRGVISTVFASSVL